MHCTATRPALLAGFAALVLGAAACSGGSAGTPVAHATGAASGPTATTAASHHGGHSGSRPPAARSGDSSASPSATPSAASGHSGSSAGPRAQASSPTAPSSGVALTPPGRYRYRVTGSAESPLGSQDIDDTSTLVVDAPDRQRQHTRESSDRGSTDQLVVARTEGIDLARITMDQDGFHEEFRAGAPALVLPAIPREGDRWHWHMKSTDGKYTLSAHLRVLDADSRTTAGGVTRPTITIASTLVVRGSSLTVTIHQQDEATRDGLIIVERAKAEGTAYGANFHSETTRRLRR